MKTHIKSDIRVKEEVLQQHILKYRGLWWLVIILAFGACALFLLSMVAGSETHQILASSLSH